MTSVPTQAIQALRGMKDILPSDTPAWQFMEAHLKAVANTYGFSEIRFPILEHYRLFSRSIGEVTDIVEKEMYVFEDRNGDPLALRPEGTASCARAVVEHNLTYAGPQRLWYCGPMFRHERPQKGRQRQFHHFGAEYLGVASPEADAECILMSAKMLHDLGLGPHLTLNLNTLGTLEERKAYRAELLAYFKSHHTLLNDEERARLDANPLRLLDSKNPALVEAIQAAPSLHMHLGDDSKAKFDRICKALDDAGIAFTVNPQLVRGLDYYAHTVYEWQTTHEGAQNAVCAGGRYDGLIEQIGGAPTPACGFAIGLERIMDALLAHALLPALPELDFYMVLIGDAASQRGLLLANQLREALPGVRLQTHLAGGSFKSQFKKADKSGAHYALILGDDEVAQGTVSLKPLRGRGEQHTLQQSECTEYCKRILNEIHGE